ncbi:hypothetical protein ACFOMD_05500 [Sphingoaurantiacus capsulatus]|uniref:Molybdopterin-binding protein n=1 Tax=Sphingoaurantiacus capsulatus TaxID=1771310 RepID=A0ABV7X790_9SPHN
MIRAALLLALAAPAAAQAATLTVEGLGAPQPFDAAALAALPAATAGIDAHGKKLDCTGVWLADLLAKAGAPAGDKLRGPLLAGTVTAMARDGYRVTFSLGEIDKSLGKAPVLVATQCNGAPLGEDGPYRLIVSGDSRPARAARMIERLVVSLPAVPAAKDAQKH